MTEYITLLGAEQVQKAASQMIGAADTFRHAASGLVESLNHQIVRVEELMTRLEVLAKEADDGKEKEA